MNFFMSKSRLRTELYVRLKRLNIDDNCDSLGMADAKDVMHLGAFGIKLKPFRGQDNEDAKLWLQRLCEFSDFQGWEEEKRLQVFPLLLEGVAELWYKDAQIDKSTFKKLQTAFLDRFNKPTPEWLELDSILNRSMGPTESVDEYISALRLRASKLNITPQIVLGAFLRGLSQDLQPLVWAQNPKTVEEAEQLAKLAEKMRKQQMSLVTTANSPAPQSTPPQSMIAAIPSVLERFENKLDKIDSKFDDYTKKVDSVCTRVDKLESRMNQLSRVYGQRTDTGKPYCGFCRVVGHSTQGCRERQRRQDAVTPTRSGYTGCYNCGSLDHRQKDCPLN